MRGCPVGAVGTLFVVSVTTVLLSGCSSGAGDSPAGNGDILPGTAALAIADKAFEPSVLTIARGSTDITITNGDITDHTFTMNDGSVDQPIAPGQSVTVTVQVPAGSSVGFHCSIHPQMTGTLRAA
jgi:plastocyanin